MEPQIDCARTLNFRAAIDFRRRNADRASTPTDVDESFSDKIHDAALPTAKIRQAVLTRVRPSQKSTMKRAMFIVLRKKQIPGEVRTMSRS